MRPEGLYQCNSNDTIGNRTLDIPAAPPRGEGGTVIAQWLRCCVTNRKVAGSIPAGVSGFFIDIKSFRSHYGPGSNQPLREMSTRSISWGPR